MTLRLVKFKPEHAVFIAQDMWARGEEEARIFGLTAIDDILPMLDRIEHAATFSYLGTPYAITGAVKAQEDVYHTVFMARPQFEDHLRAGTRMLKKHLRAQAAEKPTADIVAFSACPHPDAEKWFTLLGFEPVSSSGPVRTYKFRRKDRGDVSPETQN